ncbi:hypothetical protein HYC85_032312 [Camellia sinensis]|uniref:Bromo domain-containing protein n=1 Tax=Camellia sinensis TaxID=4442 RepID=A0A7J7FT28_CAMSI|nr:hypothetical protein HYC85_032312 [Camellia sinensis]
MKVWIFESARLSLMHLPMSMAPLNFVNKDHAKAQFEEQETVADHAAVADVDIDHREVYFLIMHFLSAGPCQRTFGQFWNELLEHQLLPRRYHAWYSRSGALSGHENDNGVSFPLSYNKLVERYLHIEKDHLVKLLKQLIQNAAPSLESMGGMSALTAVDVPTLLGTAGRNEENKQVNPVPAYLRWPHMQADQVRGLSLREIGGGFPKHHRAPSLHFACYTIAKPLTMVQKMQNIKRLRGHRDAVYCAIFDRSGRYVITGSDDRLVKIWSMETAFCLASCRGHEGDITDLAVSSNNALVASASNDYSIRVWRLPDGFPISVLRGHIGAVTAIAFSPRPSSMYQLLSSSDDGTCRIWDARYSQCSPRVYLPKPTDGERTMAPPQVMVPPQAVVLQGHQILCCAYNANGTVFVTGSSDTFARVWGACKSNTNDSEQPNHEIDLLAGHENDVNYVQFCGCAVAPRSSSLDSFTEDNKQKFKNSWFNHDNIVTCSRDGSAIIWVPRSRKSHGKTVRWTRAYHLKVPPPPMPPQPLRGGPRQRFLPTPRGVNMIVWSLDNRFVLAAIMDCRICVWNASDGSLVHSLTGHSGSTYVLDVHPFNPRIAMSAGYDGKTIVWDIWEGTPIRIYEIGRFKLVDGKFSPDGTSIVLSDEAGQIYLLNTGQGESQKDAKYDQFFLGDYRPLIQDTLGNILDQETQLSPYRRNIQDPLCDSSMIPYPEPYQSMYQQRRLGALGIEWRPSSIKFAIGTDIGLGHEILPLADLDRVIEPLPEFLDAMYWEPENEVINDDTDSEYNVTDEYSSEGEQGTLNSRSSSDLECSAEDNMVEQGHKDGLRRSKRRKHKAGVKLMTSSGRCVKRRNLDEHDGTSSRTKRVKKQKSGRKTSRRKSSKVNSSRPQRVAARNALNLFSQITTGASTDEDEGGSEDDSSESETMLQDSNMQSNEPNYSLQNVQLKDPKTEQVSLYESEDVVKPPEPLESQINSKNTRRLVVKLSLRDSKKSITLVNTRPQIDNLVDLAPSSSSPTQETAKEGRVNLISENLGSSSANANANANANATNAELPEDHKRTDLREREPKKAEGHLEASVDYKENKIKWGEVKVRTSKQMKSEDLMPTDASIGFSASFDYEDKLLSGAYRDDEWFETSPLENMDGSKNKKLSTEDVHKSSLCDFSPLDDRNLRKEHKDCSGSDVCGHYDSVVVTNHFNDLKENPPPKPTKLRFKSRKIFRDPESPSQPKFITPVDVPGVPEEDEGCDLSSSMRRLHSDSNRKLDDAGYRAVKSNWSRSNPEDYSVDLGENAAKATGRNLDLGFNFPEAATDATRRTRSMGLTATSRETDAVNHNFKVRQGLKSVGTSKSAEKFSKFYDQNLSEDMMTSSKISIRSRSSRNKGSVYYDNDQSSSGGRKSHYHLRTSNGPNWLTLSHQEEGYRYIPQLGDEVLYLRQGHQEYLGTSCLSETGPWLFFKNNIRAVELCSVNLLDYSTVPSGDSCCKITLEFIDRSSSVFGKSFKFTLPELNNFPDFVVERTRYDAAVRRNWTCRDKCLVWWRDESEQGGSWWEGRILSSKDKSNEFPGSPWERYEIQYKGDPTNSHLHSPWELHDPDIPWGHPHIDDESRDKLLSSFNHLQQSAIKNQDGYGILRLNQVARKSDFINRFPAPLSPEVIESRLKNKYYRSLEAVQHDITMMMKNAREYFVFDSQFTAKLARLSEWFSRKLSKLY